MKTKDPSDWPQIGKLQAYYVKFQFTSLSTLLPIITDEYFTLNWIYYKYKMQFWH